MRILFDHCAPAPLIPFLPAHEITEAFHLAWHELPDGNLLTEAERAGFELLLTVDKRIVDQQRLRDRRIALLVLESSKWTIVQRYVRRIAVAVNNAKPGSYTLIQMPKF